MGLWLLAGVLAARQAAAVLRLPPDERFTDLAAWIGDQGVLQVRGSLYDGDAFTGTPFSGLVLKPLTRAAEQGLGVGWTLGTLLLVGALGLVAARHAPGVDDRRGRLLAVPVAISLLALSVPVRNTFSLGQLSILPVLLVLLGALAGSARTAQRGAGVLVGLAAALHPAMLLFLPLLWLTGRRPAALVSGGVFGGATLLAWAAMPQDSWTYWVHHLAGSGLGAAPDATANQSLHGLLLRLGLSGPVEIAVFGILVVAVVVLGLRRAVHYARDGQPLLATALTGCVVVAASPTAWQHQQLWILLALVGRVGRRNVDRLVWPVFVVLVMSLDSRALVPNMAVLGVLGENAPLIAALLAACVVPFLSRTSPVWDRPEVVGPLSRPNLMLELLLIRVGYFAYSWVRSSAPDARSTAEEHGRQILAAEEFLRIDMEHWLNHAVVKVGWLESSMNFYYTAFHFVVPITLLLWLYARRPAQYRRARSALSVATLLGLVGFWLYPLAPPRLMPGLGYIDTAHGPQDLSDPNFGALTELSNQYAAMPSLHVGWSLWSGLVIWRLAPGLWAKTLGVLYPLLTTIVVMGTANHYLLDAAGGAVVVAAGFGARHLWERHRPAKRLPDDPADPADPAPAAAGERAPGPEWERVPQAAKGAEPELPPDPLPTGTASTHADPSSRAAAGRPAPAPDGQFADAPDGEAPDADAPAGAG